MGSEDQKRITLSSEIRKSKYSYFILGGVFFLSLIIGAHLGADGLKVIASSIALFPGGAAAVGIILQLIRDNQQHQRNLELQEKDHSFSLAVMSHMSEYVFKKHAEFCQEYIDKLVAISEQIESRGDTEDAIRYSEELCVIRQSHQAWLEPSINEQLLPFEKALSLMGKTVRGLSYISNPEVHSGAVDRIYNIFHRIAGLDPRDGEGPGYDHISSINEMIEIVQDIVGIRKLYEMRRSQLKQ